MDIKTGLSIYNKPWLIEPTAAIQMLDFWEKVQSGEQWNYHNAKGENDKSSPKFFAAGVIVSPDNTYDMGSFKGFDGAHTAVISISGPLMKTDYCGSLGTAKMRQLTMMAANTESVKTILFVIDSPGGTVDGTQAFADAIKTSGKQTIALVDGMMCSAAYWIGSSCDKIYSSNRTDIIGSIGTMCALKDNTEEMKAKGIVLREYYATGSTEKNKVFSDAQKGDGRALISEMLDPMNDMFMDAVKENRYGKLKPKTENVLTGKTYLAEEAIAAGLIDGIQSLDSIISKNSKSQSSIIKKSAKMEGNILTLAELKTQHPAAYEAARNEGIATERERVTSALIYGKADMEATTELIKSGGPITETFRAEMWQKTLSANTLAGMEAANKKIETEAQLQTGVDGNNAGAATAADAAESVRRVEAFKKRQGIK